MPTFPAMTGRIWLFSSCLCGVIRKRSNNNEDQYDSRHTFFQPLGQFVAFILLIGVSVANAQAPELMVKNAWARTPLAPQNNTAVYMVLENASATSRSVVSVTTQDAEKAELHEVRMEGGMMTMMPTKEIAVPAKGSVELKPGGFHIMLFALKKPVKAGDQVNVVLTLNDGATVPVAATVRAADANPSAAPSGSGRSMPGMKLMKTRRTFARLLCLVILTALAAAGCGRQEPAIVKIGGDFTLTDQNGMPFELSSLRGDVVLIFFGYTSCPDACPTTMSKLATVYRELGADASRVKTVYISVDSQRDTPAVMKEYLTNFKSINAIGLTGSREEIDKVTTLFAARYVITPLPDMPASHEMYTVGHTTSVYGLDADGRTRLIFPYEASVADMTQGIREILRVRRAAIARTPVQIGFQWSSTAASHL